MARGVLMGTRSRILIKNEEEKKIGKLLRRERTVEQEEEAGNQSSQCRSSQGRKLFM